MTLRLQKTVVLVGMMGAGKTAVGGALAKHLDVPFHDSDDEIRAAANMEIAEIFARDGEAFFRRRETEILARMLGAVPCILSTGGGVFLSEINRDLIAIKGVSVWLQADIDLLWSRVRGKDTRPLLRTANPRATLEKLNQEREASYRQADLCVQARRDYTIDDMAQKVLDGLRQKPDIWEQD